MLTLIQVARWPQNSLIDPISARKRRYDVMPLGWRHRVAGDPYVVSEIALSIFPLKASKVVVSKPRCPKAILSQRLAGIAWSLYSFHRA